MRISSIAGEQVIRSSGVNSVDSAQTDANDEIEDYLSSDADDNADDNGSDDEGDFEKYMEDEMEEESDQLSPKDKDSVKSIGQGKEVKGLSSNHLTQDSKSCKEGSNIAQTIYVNSSTQRKTFMGPKSAKERWVKKMKARQEATMPEEHDAHLDSDLIKLVQDISLKIPEQEFSDSGGEGVERNECVAIILGLDNMDSGPVERNEGSGVSVECPSNMRETANVEGGYLDTASRNRSEFTGGNVDSNSLELHPKKASADIDSKTVERSEGSGVSVERDSKVREAGNGAEDDLDLDRETVQRSESTGDLVESSSLEQPPNESKVSNNLDSEDIERSEAIAGTHSNVREPGNVEVGDLDCIDDIDSKNVESSEVFGGSRSSIVKSISLELPIKQRKLIDYTDSESDLSNEGTGVQSPTSSLQTLNIDVNEIVIAGGPSYVRGQTLYLEGNDVDSESFNRSDSTFGIIDTSSQVAIAPEVSNLSLGSRSFPYIEVSTASRRQIMQEETATEVRNISDGYISVNSVPASPIEVSTLSQCSTSLPDTEVSTASQSKISQEETATEVRNISDGYISVNSVWASPIEVSTLSRCSTSLPDTEVSTASTSEISQEGTVTEASSTEVRNTSERDISVTLVQSSTTEVRNIREREISVTLVQSSSTEVVNIIEREISVSLVQASSTEVINIRERKMGRTSGQAITSEVPKHKVKRNKQPKWISSLVDSDAELETLCSLGPRFAVAIDAEYYLAGETMYLPEVIGLYDSMIADISLEPPVQMFSAKRHSTITDIVQVCRC